MMFHSLAFLSGIALFSSVAAQNVWQVTVGDATGSTIYTPNNINASVGDTVQFTFNPKNHTVTQSTFASPCAPLSGGFDSGFNPVAVGTASNFPIFNVTVNDTNPIWVYCRQGENTPASHCGKGMVFAVNPGVNGTGNSFAAFQAAARAVGAALSSSVGIPTVLPTVGTSTATPPSSPSSTTSSSLTSLTLSTSSKTSPSPTSSSTPNGATSLIVKGSFLMSAIGGVFLWLI
ncbi:hypothetical protein EDB83DRAFT_2336437 [Lactarius deliciosus]|nr:hypothetical protein EDB83DRAFT_2336437 [Lactarius deliciosus]